MATKAEHEAREERVRVSLHKAALRENRGPGEVQMYMVCTFACER
jgi:hypothetical protein